MKRVFGYDKVRYRGLAKNTNRFYVLAGLTNLVRMKQVLTAWGQSALNLPKMANSG